jgi:hypothetical protein
VIQQFENAAASRIRQRSERIRAFGGGSGRHLTPTSLRNAASWVIPQPLS